MEINWYFQRKKRGFLFVEIVDKNGRKMGLQNKKRIDKETFETLLK